MCFHVGCSLVSVEPAASKFTITSSQVLPRPHPLAHVYIGNQAHFSAWVSANRGRVSRKSLDHCPTFFPTNPSIPRSFFHSLGLGINLGSAAPAMMAEPLHWHLRSPLLLTTSGTGSTSGEPGMPHICVHHTAGQPLPAPSPCGGLPILESNQSAYFWGLDF